LLFRSTQILRSRAEKLHQRQRQVPVRPSTVRRRRHAEHRAQLRHGLQRQQLAVQTKTHFLKEPYILHGWLKKLRNSASLCADLKLKRNQQTKPSLT
jgi:hypothetical protein